MVQLFLGQKRRILFFAVLMGLALMFLQLVPGSGALSQLFGWIITTLLMGGVAAAVVMVQPRHRGWLEIVASGCFLGGLLGQMTPFGGLVGLPLAMAFSGAGIMLFRLDWRRFLDLRITATFRREGQVGARMAEVYAACLPGPSVISARLVEVEADAEDRQTFYAAVKVAGTSEEEATVTLVAEHEPDAARYHIEGEDDEGAFSSTWVDIALTEMDPVTTHIAMAETREGLHPGDALQAWFDDALGGDYQAVQQHFAGLAVATAAEVAPLASPTTPA